MSNKFSAFEFTDEGLKVISEVLANKGKMAIMSFYTFDKVINKQIEYDQIQANNPKQFKPVGTVTAKPNNTIESRLILDNLDVTIDYSLKSVAIIGQYNDSNFILGVIFTNEVTTIPKYDGISGQSIALDVSFAISDTSVVTINTQLAGMLTVEDYIALMSYIDSKDALKADDDKVVHLFNNENVDGIKKFLKTINGSVSGNSGTTNRVNTLDLNTAVDLNKMTNGLYLATSLDKITTNKPDEAGEVFVLVVESFEQRFIDLQTNKQYYRSINGSVFNKWERFFTVSEMNNLDMNIVHKKKDESIDGNKTFLQKIIGSITGTAGTAIKLLTGRSIQTNLSSTSAANFDGTADVKPGVAGTLPVANGGTGTTTGNAPSASKLSPGRKINSVLFDGSKDITVIDSTAIHKTGDETVDGTKTFKQTIKQDMTKRPASRLALYTVTDDTYGGAILSMLASPDGYGRAIGIGSGGITVLGGGEAAASLLDAIVAGTTPAGFPKVASSENAVLASDSSAFILVGYQSGGTAGQLWEFTSSGTLNKWINGKAVNVIKADGTAVDSDAIHKKAALSVKDYSATLFGVSGAIQFHVTDTGVGVVVAGSLKNVPTSDGSKKTGAQIPAGVPVPAYDVRLPWATWSGITDVTHRTGFIGFFLLKKGSRDIYYKQQTTKEDSTKEYTPGTLGIDTSGWYPIH
ncbi:hypothetical protein G7084_01570 [Weissella coleopterorum]|uniref:BppU N-terminal domain-containing protein n=1 Tax=Weissella coleopterorum TaxID=2714949 RepID=A0A6G8AYJ1_9LACO|nr:pyocin knob domain-containing protein [Weissella coleopterorum]QIL50124.1 hypothetical protein G7084_01570 [Weissella coleopterorum]